MISLQRIKEIREYTFGIPDETGIANVAIYDQALPAKAIKRLVYLANYVEELCAAIEESWVSWGEEETCPGSHMKLAREIAEYIDDRQGPDMTMSVGGMESIIADHLAAAEKERCEWRQEDDWDCSDKWNTECGNAFWITEDGKPCADGIDFCCYCGKRIVRVDAQPPTGNE